MKEKNELYLFNYTGYIGKRKKKIKGKLAAVSKIKAIEDLNKLGIKNIKLIDKTPFMDKYFSKKKLSIKDIDFGKFFEKLATQLEVGISPAKSLENFLNEDFKFDTLIFINRVKKKLDRGYSLTEALNYPGVLSKDTIALINIGEESGKIIEILKELSKLYYEKHNIKKQVKKATYKPIGLISFAIGILLFIVPLMLKPIEGLQAQFDSKGGLPLLTQIVMNSTNFLVHNWYIFLILGMIIFFTHQYIYKRNYKYKETIDNILFNMPIIGRFNKALAIYFTILNLYILHKSGIPIEKSFKMILDAQDNEEYKKDLEEIRISLKEGNTLKDSMNYSSYFPKVYKDIIKQGEETGRMVSELEKAKFLSEKDFKETSELVISSFSKITGFLVTILIGIIIIAVYMPIFSIVGQVMEKI